VPRIGKGWDGRGITAAATVFPATFFAFPVTMVVAPAIILAAPAVVPTVPTIAIGIPVAVVVVVVAVAVSTLPVPAAIVVVATICVIVAFGWGAALLAGAVVAVPGSLMPVAEVLLLPFACVIALLGFIFLRLYFVLRQR